MSDIGLWLKSDEREMLQAFLSTTSKINQLSRYVFNVDGKTVDFSSAIPLSRQPMGLDIIIRFITGWLGNQPWILKILDGIQKKAFKKNIENL